MGQILSGTSHAAKIKRIQIASLHLKLYAVIVEFALFAVDVAHTVVKHTTIPTDVNSVHKACKRKSWKRLK